MGKAPAFQLYASDFYMDTSGWTATQIGIYFRLLMHEWVNESLPNDVEKLARIAQIDIGNFIKCYRPTIEEKFIPIPQGESTVPPPGGNCTPNGFGNLINKRLEEVRENQRKYRESQAEKGRNSAKKRWEGHITRVITTVTDRLQPDDNSSSSSSSSNNKKIIYSEGFLNWWNIYPNKVGKLEAFKAWKKSSPNMEELISAVKKQIEYKADLSKGGKFTPEWPNASTWINQKRWEDEIPIEVKTKIEKDYPKFSSDPTEDYEK